VRQIYECVNKSAVVVRLDDVLHESTVDLDDVDAELTQVAERGIAGAEIVDGDAAAEILDPGNKPTRLGHVLDRGSFGDFNDQPLSSAGMDTQESDEARPPIGVDG
jgi:hypothetical protein